MDLPRMRATKHMDETDMMRRNARKEKQAFHNLRRDWMNSRGNFQALVRAHQDTSEPDQAAPLEELMWSSAGFGDFAQRQGPLKPDRQRWLATSPVRTQERWMTRREAIAEKVEKPKKSQFQQLIDVLVLCLSEHVDDLEIWGNPTGYRNFEAPYNPHRHVFSQEITENTLRVIAERTAFKHDLLDIAGLFILNEQDWIKTRLPMTLVYVRQKAIAYVSDEASSIDRATFWTAMGKRQRPIDHLRTLSFPMVINHRALPRIRSVGTLGSTMTGSSR